MGRNDDHDLNAHHHPSFTKVKFSTLAVPSDDPLPDDLTAALEIVATKAREEFPDVFEKVDRIKSRPAWRPSWAPDACGKCGSNDWLVWSADGRRKRACNECRRRYQRTHPRKAGR